MPKNCPDKKTKRKGSCRTTNQKAGDRHRKLVLAGRAKPYAEGGKRSGVRKGRRRPKRGYDYWCSAANSQKKPRQGKSGKTWCEIMTARKTGRGKKIGPLMSSGAFMSPFARSGYHGDPLLFATGKVTTPSSEAPPTIRSDSLVPAKKDINWSDVPASNRFF